MSAKLKTDSPLSRRIATSFLNFLNSVEPSPGVDAEALDVAKDCLAEVFKIGQASSGVHSSYDSLIDIFSSRESNGRIVAQSEGLSDVPITSLGKEGVNGASGSEGKGTKTGQHSPGKDELFGQFFDALEKIHYFQRMPDGSDDQSQLDRATYLFHNTIEEMQKAGCETFDGKSLANTFKLQGNKAMQSKVYSEATELYTFAIALFGDNEVYYGNRAAAYTQMRQYTEAVDDCLKSIEINPNYGKAYSRLGFAYYAQGKYRDAIDKGFKKALQLDPNNASVKENIQAAEQKLRAQRRRAAFAQGSVFASDGGSSRSNSTVPPSMPFNINDLVPEDITSLLINTNGGSAFPEQQSENGPDGQSETGAHNVPGIRINGSNMSVNLNDLPEELSEHFRSMMGISAATPQGNQQNDSNGRPAAG